MIITTTSLAVALWERYGLIYAARRSSRKDARQMLSMCCRVDNIRSKWTPRYLTDVLKGTLFPPMFAHSLSTKATRDAEPTGKTSVLLVFRLSLLLFVQITTSPIPLNTGLNTVELIGKSTLEQLNVVCLPVIITIVDRNYI